MFVRKIIRALKKVGQQKKGKGKKTKNKTGRVIKPTDKGSRN
jgi:hypothetical protein